MLLGASFLGESDCRLSTRWLVSFLALIGSFLAGLCIGLYLRTCALYSIERHKKQTHLHGSHTFLMKVEVVLPCKWAHPQNVTHQISLSEWITHLNCGGFGTWAVVPAWQLHNVGVELLYMCRN